MKDGQHTIRLPKLNTRSEKPPRKKRERGAGRLRLWLNGKFSARAAAFCVFVVTAAAAAAVAVSLPESEGEIELPGNTPVLQEVATEEQSYLLTDADITTENVQRVIASLARPDAYSASVTNTLYWDSDWEEIRATQYVRDDVCLTEYYNENDVAERYAASKDDMYYAWRRDADTYYSGSAGIISADDDSMIPTYETVVEEEADSIVDAGLRTVNGESCIYVTVTDVETGYSLTYWVSTVSGLLVQADYVRGSQLVRSVVISDIAEQVPSKSLYLLPDGSSLLPAGAEEGEDAAEDESTDESSYTDSESASDRYTGTGSPVIVQQDT